MFRIVPNILHCAIYKQIDKALADCPQAIPDRERFYKELLDYYDEHGVIPEFTIVSTCETAEAARKEKP